MIYSFSQLIRIDKGLVFYRLLAEVSHHHHRVAPYLDEKEEDKICSPFFSFLCFFHPVPSHPSMALKGILFLSIFFFILSRAPLLGSNRCVAFSLLEDFPYRFLYRYSSGANIFFFFFKEGKIHIQKDQGKDQKEESLSNVLFDGIYINFILLLFFCVRKKCVCASSFRLLE